MAEKCEIISRTISIEGEAINHRNSMLLLHSFFRLKELFKVYNGSTIRNDWFFFRKCQKYGSDGRRWPYALPELLEARYEEEVSVSSW